MTEAEELLSTMKEDREEEAAQRSEKRLEVQYRERMKLEAGPRVVQCATSGGAIILSDYNSGGAILLSDYDIGDEARQNAGVDAAEGRHCASKRRISIMESTSMDKWIALGRFSEIATRHNVYWRNESCTWRNVGWKQT